MSLRTTVLGQMLKIRELHASDRRRQAVTSEMLKADHKRSTEMRELRTTDRTRQQQLIQTLTVMQSLQGQVSTLQGQVAALQGQVTALQGQQGPAGGPAQPELPEEAGIAMIDQGVTAALVARDANRNGDDSHTSGTGGRRTERALTWWNSHVLTISHDVAYAMTWADLRKKMTDKYCPRNEMKKLEAELWNLKVKGTDVIRYVGGLPDMIYGNIVASNPKTMQEAVEMATELMDKKVITIAERQADNKRKLETYLLQVWSSRTLQEGMPKAEEQQKPWKSSWSFVSTAFSSQIDITQSTLDHYYDVELADGRIIGLNTILRGCTLNLLNHPFNINLMPVELGSFDAIIGMDWLVKYQAIIVCAEKIVRIPWGNETLIVHGDGRNQGHEACLHIISYSKTQEYMLKGCPVFLVHVTTNEVEDKLEKKRLEDVPIVQDFPKVFPEDLPGLPLTRQVEF
ncbi:putative reverse transcriptase domain-containing protein [Tanacetum coccineum]